MSAVDCDQARLRPDVQTAALELVEQHGDALMATARRYAAAPVDAEDAFQRGVVILLTKAPLRDGRPIPVDELLAWARTVIKHEAWALRRQGRRQAPTTDDGELPDPSGGSAGTHDQAERLERLRLGAEAMRELKPQEVRALLLKAEGYSYKEIQQRTGWTYTKVNRCLTEGRASFLRRVAAIEAGERCADFASLIDRARDLGGDELEALRAHLRTCLTCREQLRARRAADAPAQAARRSAGGER